MSPNTRARIAQLRRDNPTLTYAAIAARMGISKETVARVLKGARVLKEVGQTVPLRIKLTEETRLRIVQIRADNHKLGYEGISLRTGVPVSSVARILRAAISKKPTTEGNS